MILERIIDFFITIILAIISPLTSIDLQIPANIIQQVQVYLDIVFFILPIHNIVPIIIFLFALMTYRIIISIIKTIWALIPFV